jgi:Spy/CpxP family protein refolding chaperone
MGLVTEAAWTAGGQAKAPAPTTVSTLPVTTMDDVLKAVREDLQYDRADLMAKNMTLTSTQAAKFWPIFESYQKEQSAIMDEQLRGIQRFIEGDDKLDDAAALDLAKTHLDRDIKMATLRQTWLPRFQQILGAKQAARVIQIDRRLSLVQQLRFTTKIPLSH